MSTNPATADDAGSHRVIARTDETARRTLYGNGTVSYDWTAIGDREDITVRFTVKADGGFRLYLPDHQVSVSRIQGDAGGNWGTTIELVRLPD
jgi:hypothetical protein